MLFKQYILSKFIEILPIEESFFFKTSFSKKVKLTPELIALNYNRYTPYKNPLSIFKLEKNSLFIWFYSKKKAQKIIIPEVVLLLNSLHNNSINIIQKKDFYNIMIIKEKKLLNSYRVNSVDKALLESELNRHAITASHKISEIEYRNLLKKSLTNLSYQDIYKWNQFKINKEEFLPSLVKTMAYPLSFLLFFTMGIHIFHTNQLEDEISKLEENYLASKEKNSDVKEKIQIENSNKMKWKKFIEKELPYVDPISLYVKIEEKVYAKEVTLISFSIVGSKLKVDIKTKENFVLGLNRLNKLEFLKNVSIKNANRKRNSVVYEADIVPLGRSL